MRLGWLQHPDGVQLLWRSHLLACAFLPWLLLRLRGVSFFFSSSNFAIFASSASFASFTNFDSLVDCIDLSSFVDYSDFVRLGGFLLLERNRRGQLHSALRHGGERTEVDRLHQSVLVKVSGERAEKVEFLLRAVFALSGSRA